MLQWITAFHLKLTRAVVVLSSAKSSYVGIMFCFVFLTNVLSSSIVDFSHL